MAEDITRKYALYGAPIWNYSERTRLQQVKNVCITLAREYGKPRLGNPRDPLDDLVYIILSNKTSPLIARRTYKHLKQEFGTWDEMQAAPISRLRAILKPAGLSAIKSRYIRAALRRIERDFGRCDLRALRHWPESEALEYLTALPGVSDKVAKCVMMYTLGKQVLPVDSHVYRVSKRLGWTSRNRADQSYAELEYLTPPEFRFSFHVDCIVHGRSICRPEAPDCDNCCIKCYCAYYQEQKKS
jgi:endonuclease III